MTQLLFIAIGGAIGAVLRFSVSNGVYGMLGRGFPWGTFVVNVLGSLVMGFLYVMFIERMTVSVEMRSMILIGLLGAFTTFSTFSIETLNLIESGDLVPAGINMFLSVFFSVTACWLGLLLGRQL